MDIKTIALDIDGTLLDINGNIMPKTKKSLLELQDQGIHLILASGRPVKSMLKLADELGLHDYHGVILSNNGSIGYDTKNHKIIFDTPIDKELAMEILKSFKGKKIYPMVEAGDYFLVNDVYSGFVTWNGEIHNIMEKEARTGDYLLKEVEAIEDHIDDHVNKILTIVEPAEIEKVIKENKKIFGDKIHVVQTSPYFMEFVRPESNKAYGLGKLNIDPETLMSFGDSMNDKELVEYAKYGVAMGNAQDGVKDVAYHVTSDHNSEGIYEALVHFGLIEK